MATSTKLSFETLSLLLLAWTLQGCSGPATPSAVVLIVVDTLRADHLVSYGYPRPTSESLARWTQQALLFEHAYSTSSWTLPAIGSVLTGALPSQHGAMATGTTAGDEVEADRLVNRRRKSFSRLRTAVPTIGTTLQQHGYATAAIVTNPFFHSRFGLDRGFQRYDYEARRRADEVVDLALAWLASEERSERFFLLLHLIDPHLPYDPPAQFRQRFSRDLDSELSYPVASVHKLRQQLPSLSPQAREFLRAAYDEEIAFVDQQLDRLFASMTTLGQWNDTLVILTSDHGEEHFDHDGFEHGHSLYDEVIRVPLILWGPGIAPGRSQAPVSITDIAPTILDALGIETSLPNSGSSLWPLVQGVEPPRTTPLVAENMLHGADKRALIRWPQKLIIDTASGEIELYDLQADPAEKSTLETATTAQTQELLALARALSDRPGVELESLEIDDQTLDQLRALGYLD